MKVKKTTSKTQLRMIAMKIAVYIMRIIQWVILWINQHIMKNYV